MTDMIIRTKTHADLKKYKNGTWTHTIENILDILENKEPQKTSKTDKSHTHIHVEDSVAKRLSLWGACGASWENILTDALRQLKTTQQDTPYDPVGNN
jgi:hypothetical protein